MTDPDHEDFLARFIPAQQPLRAAALACCGDPHFADEVFQETAIACWRSYGSYDPDRPFAAWARGVLRKVVANQARSQQRRGPVLPADVVDHILAVEEPESEDHRLSSLRRCLDRLSPRARQLLALRYHDDLDRSAIAGRLGSSAAAVKKALTRARSALAECLQLRSGGAESAP